jgi:hypothetical protein
VIAETRGFFHLRCACFLLYWMGVKVIFRHLSFFETVPERDYGVVLVGDAAKSDGWARCSLENRQEAKSAKPPPTRYIYLCFLCFLTHRTTPGRGSVPKWLEPGDPNVSAILENLTSVPPVISIVIGDGEIGAGFPLSVIVAVPVIRSPPVKVVVTSPSTRVTW